MAKLHERSTGYTLRRTWETEFIEYFQLRHSESLREGAEHYRKSQVLVTPTEIHLCDHSSNNVLTEETFLRMYSSCQRL